MLGAALWGNSLPVQTSPRLPATRERGLAVAGLVVLALAPVVHGVVAGPIVASALALDPARGVWVAGGRGIAVVALFAVAGAVLTIVGLIAAAGVAARQPWGRLLALGVSVLGLATGCSPLAAVVIWWLWTHPPEA